VVRAKAEHEAYVNRIADEVEEDLLHNIMGSVFKNMKLLSGSDTKPSCYTVHNDSSACMSEEEMLICWR